MFRFLAILFTTAGLSGMLALPLFAQDLPRPVKLMTVADQDHRVTRTFFGQVNGRQTVDLAFQVGGQIQDLPVIEGQFLSAGDMIAQLDMEPFALQLEQAQLQKSEADRTVDRLRRLAGSAASQVSLEQAETQAQLAALALRDAANRHRHATLQAPFDALVASRKIANFSTITAGTPVVRLHDMSELWIEINVPEVLFQRFDSADDVRFHATFPSHATRYPLVLREFTAEASAVGQTFQVTLALPSTDGLHILPGSSATVTAEAAGGLQGAVLPASAVGIDPDGSTYVLAFLPEPDGNGTLRRQSVTVQPADDGSFVAISGLETGVEIVAAGLSLLENGQSVRRFSGFGN